MTHRIARSLSQIFSTLLVSAAAISSLPANAAMDIQLGIPGYGGTGCPANTASVTLSPDQKELSILFDQYTVEAGNGRTMDRKSCNLSIPVHVPQGYSISLFQVDYRGFTSLPAGARGQFNAEYFFAGSRGVRASKSFFGPTSDMYDFTNHLAAEALVWSACGDSVNLRVNTSMLVQTNRRQEQASATVDSADVSAAIVYHVQWRQCR